MIRVTILGSDAIVDTSDQVKLDLDRYFSIENRQALKNPRLARLVRWKKWDGKIHFFSRLTGKIPAGLVPLIEYATGEEVHIYDKRPKLTIEQDKKYRRRIEKLKFKKIKLHEQYQRLAIKRAILDSHGPAIIKGATNVGKTLIATGIIKVLKRPTLYVVPRKVLLHQTAERIEEYTGIKCGKIGDGIKDPRKVTVAIVNSLPKPTKKNSTFWNFWDVLILDEAHHTAAKTWYHICRKTNIRYKFAMTGTPWTGDDERDIRMASVFGPKPIIDITNKELIDTGWSAKPTIHIWPVQNPINAYPWQAAYDFMIVSNNDYNEKICSLVSKCYEKGEPTLVLVDRTKHGILLYRRFQREDIHCRYLSGQSGSEYREKSLKEFRKGHLGVIVATPIFDEGVDVPEIKNLVLAAGGKAPVRLLQRVGRGLRKKKKGGNTVNIHDFIHYGNYHLLSHAQQRIDIYEEEKFDIRYHNEGEL